MLSSFVTRRCLKPSTIAAVTRLKHTLPDLKYDFNALEPYISADIMRIHYEKHHQTYTNNLNVAEEKLNEAVLAKDVNAIIGLQSALRFNGGGYLNHCIFWENLSPKGGGEPTGELLNVIKRDFDSFENMKNQLVNASVAIQGSGWGWLGYNSIRDRLEIATCPNQDLLQATTGLVPLFGIDVWEHAYYLQYKNLRPDYVKAIFNIANWPDVQERLFNARASVKI